MTRMGGVYPDQSTLKPKQAKKFIKSNPKSNPSQRNATHLHHLPFSSVGIYLHIAIACSNLHRTCPSDDDE